MRGANSGIGTAYLTGAHTFSLVIFRGGGAQSLVYCVLFCSPLFSFFLFLLTTVLFVVFSIGHCIVFCFFYWPLYCLLFFLLANVLFVVFSIGHCIVCCFFYWPLYCLLFFLLATVLFVVFSIGHCVVYWFFYWPLYCLSLVDYGFWLLLWNLHKK
jgi:hypothetical protein